MTREQPNGWRRGLLLQFVGRERGRNEDYAVELQRFGRIARQDQMPVMNWIEGDAEDTELFQMRSFL